MPVGPPVNPPAPLSYRVIDLLTDAFIEIGACPPGELPSNEELQWGFRKLNRDVVGIFVAKRAFVWSYAFSLFNTVAGLNPHTLGPSGVATWSTGNQPRPVKIESAQWVLQNSSETGAVYLPINIRDDKWWANNQVPNIQTNVVTDLYYDPTSPDGSAYLWPVPSFVNQIRVQLWQTVTEFVTVQDPIGGPGGPGTLPQAYRSALTLTLAELLCPGANKEPSDVLIESAKQARIALFGNNSKSPRIQTADSGMPNAGSRPGTRQDFNWAYGNYPGGRPQ